MLAHLFLVMSGLVFLQASVTLATCLRCIESGLPGCLVWCHCTGMIGFRHLHVAHPDFAWGPSYKQSPHHDQEILIWFDTLQDELSAANSKVTDQEADKKRCEREMTMLKQELTDLADK